MSANLEFSYPADDLAAQVAPIVTIGTAAALYPVANLSDGDPAHPFKVNETTFRLVWDYGVPVSPKFAMIVHPNFTDGLTGVKYQGNSSSDFSAPAYEIEFPAATYHEDDFPANLGVDMRDDDPSFRYWSLVNTVANVVPVSVGLFVVSSNVRALDGRFVASAGDDEDHPLVENRTDVGVSTIYIHGTRLRWLRGDVVEQATNALAIRSWNRATSGRGLGFMLLPHLDGDEPWFVRFEKTNQARSYLGTGLDSRFNLAFEEMPRGLKPTPSAV